ncbi:MAG: hypothetical protein GXO84_10800 [Chlorobi bacterium]|nr:hypothetical protein [Chlorobiota bacterium]
MKMKIWDLTIITFALSIFGIIISAFILGQKYFDFNVWTALLIYTIPALILSSANGIILISIQKLSKNTFIRIGLGLIPIIVLGALWTWTSGPLNYIAEFGLIPIIITNLIWVQKFSKFNKTPRV